jgi:hypothetical protein
MRLISTEHGQVFQQLVPGEVRPPSGLYIPDLLQGIQQRYGFLTAPNPQDAIKEGAKFEQGRMIYDNRTIEIRQMGIYADGMLIITWNTDDANVILEDLISWGKTSLGFRAPVTVKPKKYISSLVTEFDVSLDNALMAFQQLKDQFSEIIQTTFGFPEKAAVSRIAFGVDPTTLPHLTSFEFIIERRASVSYSQNRYFSSTTLETESHLQLLQNLERRILNER